LNIFQFLPIFILLLKSTLQILVETENQSPLFVNQFPKLRILRGRVVLLFQKVHNDSLSRTSGIYEVINIGWAQRVDIKGRSLRGGG
jgi:hypothetical protein